MPRTKKSNFDGSGYQKAKERIAILENAIMQALAELPDIVTAKQTLITAWTKEQNL